MFKTTVITNADCVQRYVHTLCSIVLYYNFKLIFFSFSSFFCPLPLLHISKHILQRNSSHFCLLVLQFFQMLQMIRCQYSDKLFALQPSTKPSSLVHSITRGIISTSQPVSHNLWENAECIW